MMTGTSRSAVSRYELLEDFDAVHPRHDDVEKDDGRGLLSERPKRLLAAGGDAEDVPVPLERTGQDGAIERVVVDDQHDPLVIDHSGSASCGPSDERSMSLDASRTAGSRGTPLSRAVLSTVSEREEEEGRQAAPIV